jgi:hypothetical protein
MASRVRVDVAQDGLRGWAKLETDLEFVSRVGGKRAMVMALNRMRVTVMGETARRCWKDLQYKPLVDSQGRKISSKRVKTGIKLTHIRKRIFMSQANKNKQYSDLVGYSSAIPAMRLTSKSKSGETTTKGKFIKRKSTRTRSTLGGVSIGGVVFPGAFVQFVRRNSTFHIFKRSQKETWKPGKSGWGRAPGTTEPDRMPYPIVKIPIHDTFDKHFQKVVNEVFEKRASLEYTRALGVVGGSLMKAGKL